MDQFLLQAITTEAGGRLLERELLRVAYLGQCRYLLRFATPRNDNLLISVRPDLPRLHLTPRGTRFLELSPDRFAAWLDDEIGGATLERIEKSPWDRVVTLWFRLTSAGGTAVSRRLVVELLGRSSNIVALDGEGRVRAFARELNSAFRAPRVGEPYRAPVSREDYSDLALEPGSLPAIRRRWEDAVAFLQPLSPLLANDLRSAAGGQWDRAAERRLEEILAAVGSGDWKPVIYSKRPLAALAEGDRLDSSELVVAPLHLLSPQDAVPGGTISLFDSPSEAVHAGFDLKERLNDFLALCRHHQGLARRECDRLDVLIGKLEKELERARDADRHRRHGEALLAGLTVARMAGETAIVPDPEDPAGKAMQVPIDPQRSLQENARRCFERYKKGKRAVGTIEERLQAAQERRAAWEGIVQQASAAGGPEDLERLREAMARLGLVHAARRRRSAPPGRSEPPPSRVRQHLSPDGLTILIGRSGAENDTLTFKIASPWDFWLHAAGTSGAHVVVRNPQRLKALPAPTLRRAAEIAAYHSGARMDGAVDVHYTQRKHVHKRRGMPPGQVILKRFRSLRVAPRLPDPPHRDV
jgi:predicted ribosome quality control (RQC) complex YloA/Tae2 family protein